MSKQRLGFIAMAVGRSLVAAAVALLPAVAHGQSAEEFFKTASLSMYVGSGGGGGYDAIARLLARHMSRYLPGNPNFVIKNMPTAAGVASANFIYNSAPRDGSAILAAQNASLMLPLYDSPVADYDPRKLEWIGSTDKQQAICVTSIASPIRTLQDATRREVPVAATGVSAGPGVYPKILNALFGTKFKVISGYDTGSMRLAVEKGEVEGICGLAWQTVIGLPKSTVKMLWLVVGRPHDVPERHADEQELLEEGPREPEPRLPRLEARRADGRLVWRCPSRIAGGRMCEVHERIDAGVGRVVDAERETRPSRTTTPAVPEPTTPMPGLRETREVAGPRRARGGVCRARRDRRPRARADCRSSPRSVATALPNSSRSIRGSRRETGGIRPERRPVVGDGGRRRLPSRGARPDERRLRASRASEEDARPGRTTSCETKWPFRNRFDPSTGRCRKLVPPRLVAPPTPARDRH